MTVSFNAQLAQLGGMIRYEFLMGWRRKTMLVLLFPLLLIASLFVVTGGVQADELRTDLALRGATPAEIERMITLSIMGGTWMAFGLVLVYIAPFGAADSIPKDQAVGVRELLDSLPLSSRVYLGGKMLGLWANVLVALGFYTAVTTIICRIAIGPYDIMSYLGMWALVGGSMSFVHTGIVLLLAAGQSTRRGAITVAVVIAIVMMLLIANSFKLGINTWDYFNPNQSVLTQYYLFNVASKVPLASTGDLLLTLGAAYLELGIVAVGAWWWLRRQRDM